MDSRRNARVIDKFLMCKIIVPFDIHPQNYWLIGMLTLWRWNDRELYVRRVRPPIWLNYQFFLTVIYCVLRRLCSSNWWWTHAARTFFLTKTSSSLCDGAELETTRCWTFSRFCWLEARSPSKFIFSLSLSLLLWNTYAFFPSSSSSSELLFSRLSIEDALNSQKYFFLFLLFTWKSSIIEDFLTFLWEERVCCVMMVDKYDWFRQQSRTFMRLNIVSSLFSHSLPVRETLSSEKLSHFVKIMFYI